MPVVPTVIRIIPEDGYYKDQIVYFAGYMLDGSPRYVQQCDNALRFANTDTAMQDLTNLIRQGYMVGTEEL